MIKKIVAGGQSGADIAGIDAAIANSIPYGGWIPKGRRTEDGPLPEKYHLQEMTSTSYPKRTEQNVIDSDGTIIFTHGRLSGGSDLTRKVAEKHGKPWLHLNMKEYSVSEAIERLRDWSKEYGIEILNIAGRSASKDPDIYSVMYRVVSGVLKKLYSPNSPVYLPDTALSLILDIIDHPTDRIGGHLERVIGLSPAM